MNYRVRFTPEALELLRDLPTKEAAAIFRGVERFAEDQSQLYNFRGLEEPERNGDIDIRRSNGELVVYSVLVELSDVSGKDADDPFMLILAFWPSIGDWPG